MAEEISLNWKLSALKGNFSRTPPRFTKLITLSAASPRFVGNTIAAGFAAHEALPLGDVSTPGITFLKNYDATNFVQLGVDVSGTFYPVLKFLPGEAFPFRLANIAPYVKADTASCETEYEIWTP